MIHPWADADLRRMTEEPGRSTSYQRDAATVMALRARLRAVESRLDAYDAYPITAQRRALVAKDERDYERHHLRIQAVEIIACATQHDLLMTHQHPARIAALEALRGQIADDHQRINELEMRESLRESPQTALPPEAPTGNHGGEPPKAKPGRWIAIPAHACHDCDNPIEANNMGSICTRCDEPVCGGCQPAHRCWAPVS